MTLQKFRFFGGVILTYSLTIGTIGALLYSSHLFGNPVWVTAKPIIVSERPTRLPPKVITGTPVRIVIPSAGIDLPVDIGTYNKADGSWTLSPTHAEFANMTMPANNHSGTTFIYGHGTDAVFGKIGEHPPADGTIAKIYTNNNHVFRYALQSVRNHKPTDTSALNNIDGGSPRLIIQTCAGAFSEWRTMFTFSYTGVN